MALNNSIRIHHWDYVNYIVLDEERTLLSVVLVNELIDDPLAYIRALCLSRMLPGQDYQSLFLIAIPGQSLSALNFNDMDLTATDCLANRENFGGKCDSMLLFFLFLPNYFALRIIASRFAIIRLMLCYLMQ